MPASFLSPFVCIWQAIRSFFLKILGRDGDRKTSQSSLVDLERCDTAGGVSQPGRYASNSDPDAYVIERRSQLGVQQNYMMNYQQQNLARRTSTGSADSRRDTELGFAPNAPLGQGKGRSSRDTDQSYADQVHRRLSDSYASDLWEDRELGSNAAIPVPANERASSASSSSTVAKRTMASKLMNTQLGIPNVRSSSNEAKVAPRVHETALRASPLGMADSSRLSNPHNPTGSKSLGSMHRIPEDMRSPETSIRSILTTPSKEAVAQRPKSNQTGKSVKFMQSDEKVVKRKLLNVVRTLRGVRRKSSVNAEVKEFEPYLAKMGDPEWMAEPYDGESYDSEDDTPISERPGGADYFRDSDEMESPRLESPRMESPRDIPL